MYNAAAESLGANLALKKKEKNPQVSTYICGFKESFFPYSCKFYRQPMVVAVGGVVGEHFFFSPPP